MTDIEQYFNDADHTIVFGELKDDEETIRSGVRGKSRMVIALLLKLTSNALKESKYVRIEFTSKIQSFNKII